MNQKLWNSKAFRFARILTESKSVTHSPWNVRQRDNATYAWPASKHLDKLSSLWLEQCFSKWSSEQSKAHSILCPFLNFQQTKYSTKLIYLIIRQQKCQFWYDLLRIKLSYQRLIQAIKSKRSWLENQLI